MSRIRLVVGEECRLERESLLQKNTFKLEYSWCLCTCYTKLPHHLRKLSLKSTCCNKVRISGVARYAALFHIWSASTGNIRTTSNPHPRQINGEHFDLSLHRRDAAYSVARGRGVGGLEFLQHKMTSWFPTIQAVKNIHRLHRKTYQRAGSRNNTYHHHDLHIPRCTIRFWLYKMNLRARKVHDVRPIRFALPITL